MFSPSIQQKCLNITYMRHNFRHREVHNARVTSRCAACHMVTSHCFFNGRRATYNVVSRMVAWVERDIYGLTWTTLEILAPDVAIHLFLTITRVWADRRVDLLRTVLAPLPVTRSERADHDRRGSVVLSVDAGRLTAAGGER